MALGAYRIPCGHLRRLVADRAGDPRAVRRAGAQLARGADRAGRDPGRQRDRDQAARPRHRGRDRPGGARRDLGGDPRCGGRRDPTPPSWRWRRPSSRSLAGSIPFAVNGHVGILGVGLVNDDMANHLLIADWLNTRVGEMPALIHQGYPVGPHALVAGLVEGLGTGPIEAFAGLTLAIPVLTALVAFEALDGVRRVPGSWLRRSSRFRIWPRPTSPRRRSRSRSRRSSSSPSRCCSPTATTARRAIPLGVIAAGAVYAYSFPGLFWLAGTAAIYLARPSEPRARRRAARAVVPRQLRRRRGRR